jgi:MFS family permease
LKELELLQVRRFWPIFWTQFFGAFNDNFFKNALIILITYRATALFTLPPEQVVALSGGIFILPFFLFSGLAGELADHFEKSKIVRIIKLIEIAIMALATYGFIEARFEFLMVVLFLMGMHSTFFGPIKYSILPQHLDFEDIVGGNALIEAGTFLAILLGTITGGVLISLPQGTVLVSMGLIVAAVIGLVASLFIPLAKPLHPQVPFKLSAIASTFAVLRLARVRPVVWSAMLAISWFWAFGAVLLSLFPSLCRDVLKGSEHLVTMFLALFSIGIALGSIVVGSISKGRIRMDLVILGGVGLSAFAAVLSFACRASTASLQVTDLFTSAQGLVIFLSLIAMSFSGGMFIVPLYALMQSAADPAHRSRIIAANNIMNALYMVLASLFLTSLLQFRFSIAQILLIQAALNAVFVFVAFKMRRRFNEEYQN